MKWKFWEHHKAQDPASPSTLVDLKEEYDLVPSLTTATQGAGLKPNAIFLAIISEPDKSTPLPERSDIFISDGKNVGEWRVESLRELFRGNRQPPPGSKMEHYPEQYVPFFYRIEYNVYSYCQTMDVQPTDNEFMDIYSQMKRRPDGKSTGRIHDIIWQSTALALGMRPWSESEYMAIFGQLTRSTRHFKIGPSSRNYIEYVRQTIGREDG